MEQSVATELLYKCLKVKSYYYIKAKSLQQPRVGNSGKCQMGRAPPTGLQGHHQQWGEKIDLLAVALMLEQPIWFVITQFQSC